MYAQGEYLFAILTLILVSAGLYVFANRRAYAWRYVYPGVAGMGLFVLFPLICTIAIAFTNYSSTNQLTFERAQSVLMQRQFQSGKTFTFGLYPAENQQWRLQLTPPDGEAPLISEPFRLDAAAPQTLKLTAQSAAPQGEHATLRVITQNRQALSQL
ncbi:maltose ABC transporter permease MalF, partial [Pseudomonas aeruginosa]